MDSESTSQLFKRQPGVPLGPGVINYAHFPYTNLRSVWAMIFVLLMVWLLAWLVEIFWKLFVRRLEALPPPRAGQLAPPEPYVPAWGEKLANASRIVRDSFALLFASILLIQSGIGMTGYLLGILWATFAVLAFWGAIKLVTDNAWLDLILWVPVTAFLIAIFSLGFGRA